MPTAQVVRRHQRRGATRGDAVVTPDVDEAQPRRDGSAPWTVSRPALVNRLLAARDAPLAILVAPPGYGKTTLLSEWAEHDQRTFLWVGASDRRTYGTDQAATSIIAALGERGLVEPATCSALMGLVSLGAADVLGAAVRCVRPKSAFVLVIDDAHDLPPALLPEIVEPLLNALPRGSAVALASRIEPPLPLGRLYP